MTHADFIDSALALQGIRFCHQGRSTLQGVDCAGLVLLALENKGWSPLSPATTNLTDYRRIPDGVMLRDYLLKEADEIEKRDAVPGDLVLFAFGKDPQHLAILVPTPDGLSGTYLIHSVNRYGVVVHRYAAEWQRRTIGFYRIKGMVP